ncbi:transcriptional regulator, SARP family protein [Streptomyces sp. SDr-06]|uniref:ATP-binding protein n=1 Tax=Streptomyces sp. SDr-06 TaxID=2267702 RepID=UPI000DE978BE|nr:tetratricopeptide repeat protein [Streptomyces sp. SDr-06]RCH67640.1 transcriptional regulator, SARP family protein [Streptomyces sp. SDr-06]
MEPLRPRPDEPTQSVGDYIRDLRALKARAGQPSLQELQRRSGIARSTLSDALSPRRRELPRLEVCLALVRACGVRAQEEARWRERWQRIAEARDAGRSAPAAGDAAPTVHTRVAPRQLPYAVRHFTGRARELKRLDELMADRRTSCGAVVISAIAGTAGVGKTTLALHFAHQVAERFPDGQLFANLRGFDPAADPVDAADVARGFLDALGVPGHRIPADPEGQLAVYRSRLAGSRTLIVLDNAREVEQVRPLLPGSDGCLVLVTSRNRLSSLIALDGAVPLPLDVLSREEAHELLLHRLGPEPVLNHPEATDELIELCARLPLALNIAAARAADRPGVPLDTWVDELRDTRARLDLLAADDGYADVRAVLSWSYRALPPQSARLFRLLGLHPGPDISTAAAASLAGLPLSMTKTLLDELHRAHLVTRQGGARYTFHDLLRAYAIELVEGHDCTERAEATLRMFDHYLHSSHRAGSLAYADEASWPPLDLTEPVAGVTPEDLSGRQQALAWYEEERTVLVHMAVRALHDGFPNYAWQLAGSQVSYLLKSGLWQQWQQVGDIALAAAEQTRDPGRQAHAHRWLGQVHRSQGRQIEAHTQLRRAFDLFGQVGDRTRQGRTQIDIAIAYGEQHDHAMAIAESRSALELFEAVDDPTGQATALNSIGWYLALRGEPGDALPYCRRALELARAHGNLPAQSSTLDSIGFIHHQLGEYEKALPAYQESLDLRQSIGDYFLQAEIHTHIGDTHFALGDTHAARASWTASLAILDDLQHRDAEAIRTRLDEHP